MLKAGKHLIKPNNPSNVKEVFFFILTCRSIKCREAVITFVRSSLPLELVSPNNWPPSCLMTIHPETLNGKAPQKVKGYILVNRAIHKREKMKRLLLNVKLEKDERHGLKQSTTLIPPYSFFPGVLKHVCTLQDSDNDGRRSPTDPFAISELQNQPILCSSETSIDRLWGCKFLERSVGRRYLETLEWKWQKKPAGPKKWWEVKDSIFD